MMPELTASSGAPRIAAIERPFGLTAGLPGDASGQLAVLRAALKARGLRPPFLMWEGVCRQRFVDGQQRTR
jgi:hypothetical protein